MSMAKNGCGVLGHRTLKSALLYNKLINSVDFLLGDRNPGKPEVTLLSFEWALSK